MSEIKFTEEELQSLSDLSKKYQDIQLLMGQVSVQKLVNTQRAEKIEENELQLQADYVEAQEKLTALEILLKDANTLIASLERILKK